MSALKSRTHHILKLTIVDHLGEHDGGTAYVHKSRACLNCDSYSPGSGPDWDAEVDGPCINGCSAAEHADDGAYCPDHQTKSEFAAGLHRAHVQMFEVVEGGAA